MPHRLIGSVLRRTPGRPPFHPASGSLDHSCRAAESSSAGPKLFSAHDHGRLRSNWATAVPPRLSQPSRRPDCTLSRLHFYLFWGVAVRSAGDPIDTPDPDPRSNGLLLRSLRPRMSRHIQKPTVLSRGWAPLPCRYFFTVFTSLVCYPGPLLTAGDNGWLLGRTRWGLWVHRTTWWPLTLLTGSPALPPCATHWRYLPRLLDGTTAGRYFAIPLLRVPPLVQGCSDTRRLGTLASPPPPVTSMPWWFLFSLPTVTRTSS